MDEAKIAQAVVGRYRRQASDWEADEKRGEWNLILSQVGARFTAFMKNPVGGGGGGNRYTGSVNSAINAELRRVGWGNPKINPQGKNKVWVVLRTWNGSDYQPYKQWWVKVPSELMEPPRELTREQLWDLQTR